MMIIIMMLVMEDGADDDDDDDGDDDGKVEWPPEQRKKICINASGHPWYPIHVNSHDHDIPSM